MIRSLTKEELALRWKEIKPYIDKAVEHGVDETSSMDMFIGAMSNKYECIEATLEDKTVSYGMLRVNHFEGHSQLQIVTATGSGFDEWAEEGLEYVEAYAKEIGCKYVTIWGRLGWPKKLKRFGYRQIYSVCAKEV